MELALQLLDGTKMRGSTVSAERVRGVGEMVRGVGERVRGVGERERGRGWERGGGGWGRENERSN